MPPKHSRLGCRTCKVRRVKCDETQPECLKCVKTGRKCEGPGTERLAFRRYVPKRQSSSSPESVLSITPSCSTQTWGSRETRAFDFYVQQAAPGMSGSLDAPFWTQILPQLCIYDATIRSAVLAVSVFYECPMQIGFSGLSDQQVRGIKWYERSVATALTVHPETDLDNLEYSILTCMLFIIIEMQNNNALNAMYLLKHGFNLIANYLKRQTRPDLRAPWIMHLLPMFARMTGAIGYRLELPDEHDDTVLNLLPTTNAAVRTLADARDTSHYITNRALMLARALHSSVDREITEAMLEEQHDILQWLAVWEERMLALRRETSMSPAMLRLYHALFSFERGLVWFVSQLLTESSDSTDADLEIFNEILDHAEEALDYTTPQTSIYSTPPFMLEPGVIPAICFVGWSCHGEFTYNRATDLMKRAVRLENVQVARGQVDTIAGILKGDPTKYDRSTQNGFAEDIFASLSA
jgi:hypothetical protein